MNESDIHIFNKGPKHCNEENIIIINYKPKTMQMLQA